MHLNARTFRATANSSHGTLNTDTWMTFSEDASQITGVYSGGTIKVGHVVAQRTGEVTLEMLYQCITTDGELKAGRATARFSEDAPARVSMHLDWQWLTGDQTAGSSEWQLEAPYTDTALTSGTHP